MPSPIERNFRKSWETLLNFAIRKGVPYQDAEDLVSATLQIALDQFSEERGKFLPFCTTILGNRIKNYWRDRKPNDPIDDTDITDPDRSDYLESEEERARMKKMIDRIREDLTPEEVQFINALGVAFEGLESRAVSQAARSLGLEPEKGWDIFRRIQRKAKSLFPVLEIGETRFMKVPPAPAAKRTSSYEIPELQRASRFPLAAPAPLFWSASIANLARFAIREEAFARAMGSFTADQKRKLQAIFA